LNYSLYTFFFRQRGLLFACFCIPLHWLYFVCSGLSYGYVKLETRFTGKALCAKTTGLHLNSPLE
jgi:hypothetical protein